MFTIANAIAYQNKMIFFDPDRPESRLPPADTLDVGPSAWVCLGGVALNKHVVREQVELVVEAASLSPVARGVSHVSAPTNSSRVANRSAPSPLPKHAAREQVT